MCQWIKYSVLWENTYCSINIKQNEKPTFTVEPALVEQSGQKWGGHLRGLILLCTQVCFGQGLVVGDEGVVVQDIGCPR